MRTRVYVTRYAWAEMARSSMQENKCNSYHNDGSNQSAPVQSMGHTQSQFAGQNCNLLRDGMKVAFLKQKQTGNVLQQHRLASRTHPIRLIASHRHSMLQERGIYLVPVLQASSFRSRITDQAYRIGSNTKRARVGIRSPLEIQTP